MRKNEVWKRKEAREAAKEAIKVKGHTKDRCNIEKAIEKLTLSEQSDSESDAQCPKCGLTFQEDGSNSVWVCVMVVWPGWISTVQAYLILMISLKCIIVVGLVCYN